MPSDDDYRPRSVWELQMSAIMREPRFYPPGQHPATARWRAQIEQLEMWDSMDALIPEGQKLLDYLRQELANFDAYEAEIRAKLDLALWDDFLRAQINDL